VKIIALFITLSWVSVDVFSCSCARMSLPAAFEYYEFIFIGRVVKHDHASWIDENLDRFEFKVSHRFKENLDSEATVYSHPSTASCGFKFEQSVEYLVFANIPKQSGSGVASHQQSGFPNVSLCSPTTPTSPSAAELERRKVMRYLEKFELDI